MKKEILAICVTVLLLGVLAAYLIPMKLKGRTGRGVTGPSGVPSGRVQLTSVSEISDTSSSPDISSWKTVADLSGYTVSYPSDWFTVVNSGALTTIQSWNPAEVTDSRPLGEGESKWDVSFNWKPYTALDTAVGEEYRGNFTVENASVEHRKNPSGFDIYTIEGSAPYYGDSSVKVPVLDAVIVDGGKYIYWHAQVNDILHIPVLKSIAASVSK